MDVITNIRQKAKTNLKTIVLPEYNDPRVQEARRIIEREGIAKILFLSPDKMDPAEKERFSLQYYEMRKSKGLGLDEARKIFEDPLYYTAMLAREGKIDGFVAGASHTTPDMARAAIHCLGVEERLGLACSCFIMTIPDFANGEEGAFIFADCGIVPDPNPRQLSCIAVLAAELGKKVLGIPPRVAFLSYSSKGSAKGGSVDKIREAMQLLRNMSVDFLFDGELQVDAAIIPEVAKIKKADAVLGGHANVLIFPNLEAGNIGYKLVERMSKGRALGPLLLGLNKPCSDLSRGCSAEDVVDCVAVTAVRAQ
ncbi:MAG: phosphate acyltransferase [Candidatus Omnitrophica bacterium]|nr:phosphate acyltransferase [Candidatus Omnitrophota bacterium]